MILPVVACELEGHRKCVCRTLIACELAGLEVTEDIIVSQAIRESMQTTKLEVIDLPNTEL